MRCTRKTILRRRGGVTRWRKDQKTANDPGNKRGTRRRIPATSVVWQSILCGGQHLSLGRGQICASFGRPVQVSCRFLESLALHTNASAERLPVIWVEERLQRSISRLNGHKIILSALCGEIELLALTTSMLPAHPQLTIGLPSPVSVPPTYVGPSRFPTDPAQCFQCRRGHPIEQDGQKQP